MSQNIIYKNLSCLQVSGNPSILYKIADSESRADIQTLSSVVNEFKSKSTQISIISANLIDLESDVTEIQQKIGVGQLSTISTVAQRLNRM